MGCSQSDINKLKWAKGIVGDRAEWELKNMRKALNMFPILNTDEETRRLKAVEIILKLKKKCSR